VPSNNSKYSEDMRGRVKMKNDTSNLKLIKSYNRSVLIDQLIFFGVLCIVVFVIQLTSNTFVSQNPFFAFVLFIVILCLHLFSDILFGGRSLGKRLYRITIYSINLKTEKNKLSFLQCLHRRLLEIVYNPYYCRDLVEAFKKIEKKTGTVIVYYERRDRR